MTGMAKNKRKPDESAKKPNRSGRAVNVWVSQVHAASLDAFMAKRGKLPPTLTSVIELAMEELFRKDGSWQGGDEL